MPPIEEMERAYLERDASYNGLFYFGVRTTGVFCRPTCPARKPLARNVEYFATAAAAVQAGYRPCKRCRPLEWDDQPRWARDLLEEIEREPARRITDADLRRRGMDPATVRRHFLRRYGMTFQAYARAWRLSSATDLLDEQDGVDAAVFASGYDSHSGFREAFARLFGETPGRSHRGASVRLSWINSPLGPLVVGATDDGVCLLEFGEPERLEAQIASLRRQLRLPVVPGDHRYLENLRSELTEYFNGHRREFSVPLTFPGTAFQQRVWSALLTIPYGETRSYARVAEAIGVPTAMRAVGRANGQNRIAIVIPCHRVVNKSGSLGGYGGGLRRKEFLLHLEQQATHPALL